MLRSSELLPLLPGNTFKNIKKIRFQKSHHWDTLNGIPILADGKRSGIGGDPIATDNIDVELYPSLYPPFEGPKLPSWIVYDGKVLCFMGYFKETLQEVHRATYQVRKIKIYFYLEDGTMQVSEPRIGNSGLLQGCIVSRQRIPRPPPNHNDFITCLDLNVNQTVRIFDRCYHITDCDIFTRHFLNRMGISVGDPVQIPIDPSSEIRKQSLMAATKSNKVIVHADTLGQFLMHDRQVLKFNGYWDDRNTMFGYVHEMILYYFLADDTVQIQEIMEKNQFGRHVSGIFLRRQKLPKECTGIIQSSQLGQNTSYTILNVLGGGLTGGRFIRDGLGIGTNTIDYYKDNDLSIGASVNVYGREIILINCDEFTREYYRNKYGIEDFISMEMPNNSADNTDAAVAAASYNTKTDRVLPIFNGWGTHEDSEGNCKTVEPKPPRIDFNKFLKLDGYLLRFGAKMISAIPENMERIFIITYYLSDDTISVYELTVRNSGFKPGDFFKRSKFFLPNQQWYSAERPKIYTSQQFYIGATIQLNNFTFYIVSADKFCLNYMENHPFDYPNANIELIMNKIRTAIRSQYKQFIGRYLNKTIVIDGEHGQGLIVICHDVIRDAIIELLGRDNITNHEIITFIRYFSIDKNLSKFNPDTDDNDQYQQQQQCNRETVRSVVHLELQRNLWNDLERLHEHLIHLDYKRSEFMNENTLYYAILACRLPIKPILIRNMFSVLTKNSDGDIELRDFLNFINVQGYKSAPIQPLNLDNQVCNKGNLPFQQEEDQFVNWNSFIEKLGLEEQLKD